MLTIEYAAKDCVKQDKVADESEYYQPDHYNHSESNNTLNRRETLQGHIKINQQTDENTCDSNDNETKGSHADLESIGTESLNSKEIILN